MFLFAIVFTVFIKFIFLPFVVIPGLDQLKSFGPGMTEFSFKTIGMIDSYGLAFAIALTIFFMINIHIAMKN